MQRYYELKEKNVMNRREFLKSTLTVAALGSVAHLAGAAENSVNIDKRTGETGPQVTRRPYKNTGMTLPLLGFGSSFLR